jgi:hypothetical protein
MHHRLRSPDGHVDSDGPLHYAQAPYYAQSLIAVKSTFVLRVPGLVPTSSFTVEVCCYSNRSRSEPASKPVPSLGFPDQSIYRRTLDTPTLFHKQAVSVTLVTLSQDHASDAFL